TTQRGESYPWFPTVFRPTFGTNETEVFISGYLEEAATDFLYRPWHSADDPNDRPISSDDNVIGIPIILGAKKGLPNFNEFSSQTVVQFTRKIEMRKPVEARFPSETNQMLIIGISNVFGVETWYPYSASYPRSLDVYAKVTSTCTLTNDDGLRFSSTFTNDSWLSVPAGSWSNYG